MGAIVEENLIVGQGTDEKLWLDWLRIQNFPHFDKAMLPQQSKRLVIVSPHPDDEVLGCGGLIALAKRDGINVVLIAVTDGEGSHPESSLWNEKQLAETRTKETAQALTYLDAEDIEIIRCHLNDGAVHQQYPKLLSILKSHIYATDTVVCTWSQDGHPDHEAVGKACLEITKRFNNPLLEMPIWAWHWAYPNDRRVPWHTAIVLDLDFETAKNKRLAIEKFKSQIEADSSTGNPAILPSNVLKRFYRPFELFFVSR